jgi:hypothetical protein
MYRLKALTPTARQWKNTKTEFGFLEAVRHCNDAIGKVRNVKHVDAKLSKYVTNRWPEVLRPELESERPSDSAVNWGAVFRACRVRRCGRPIVLHWPCAAAAPRTTERGLWRSGSGQVCLNRERGVCRVLVMLSFPPISVVGSVHTTPELSGLGWGHKNVLS